MKKIGFYLVTDTHYFENSLGAEGKAYESYMNSEQFFMKESSAIIHSTFNRIAEDKDTDIVIIPGDLTKNGEKESHAGFIKELYALREKGKKIYVITAGHDYNEYSYGYKNDERINVEGASFCDFTEMYRDFGHGDAIAFDEPTHSYVAEIEEKVRLLAICCDSENQPKGTIDDRLLSWIEEQLKKAKEDNCYVFAICHYPVIPGVPAFDLVNDAKVREWRKFASFLADNGVELIFTGHMHIQSINEFYSEKGNRLIDICTSCLVGSPAKYRKITIDENSVLTVETIDVEDFGWDMKGLTVREYFDNQFRKAIIAKIHNALGGGKGIVKHLKKFAKNRFDKVTLGSLGRLLFIKVDKNLRKKKFKDFVSETGVAIFMGDQPYVKGTPEYDMIFAALKRVSFILKKVEPKLSKNGVKVDLTDMFLNTVGNNKGFSDTNEKFTLSDKIF